MLVVSDASPLRYLILVGSADVFGTQYAMRIWLDPAKLAKYGLTPIDVSSAVQMQNVQVSAGELGGLPAVNGQSLNATIIGPAYLKTPDDLKLEFTVDAPNIDAIAAMRRKDAHSELARWLAGDRRTNNGDRPH